MRSVPNGLIVKVAIIVFVLAVCIGATAIHAWQARAIKSQPAAGGGTFMPTSTTTIW